MIVTITKLLQASQSLSPFSLSSMPPCMSLSKSHIHPMAEAAAAAGLLSPGSGEAAAAAQSRCLFCSENNFEFAFNDAHFSDRTLLLDIVEDSPEGNGGTTAASCSPASAKRKRDGGDGNAPVSRVEKIRINSMLLAAKSPFFRTKFSGETEETESREVTLRFSSAKASAFMDVLKFMYGTVFSAKTPNALLEVFYVAFEYNVPSCIKCCASLLQSFPMTCELALLYLSLPHDTRVVDGIKQLVDAALDFLPELLKDITKYLDAALKLPLDRIKVLLSSDDLRLESEDAVFDFAVKWVRLHFNDFKERRAVFKSDLCCLIRFPNMSYGKLMTVLYCRELDPSVANDIVLAALFSKGGELYRPSGSLGHLPELPCHDRAYKWKSVNLLKYNDPCQGVLAHMDLKKEEFESGPISSQDIRIGGECFYLGAHRNRDGDQSSFALGLYLYRKKSKQMSQTLKVECDISVRQKSVSKYTTKKKMVCTFVDDKALGFRNLLDTSWDAFLADDSPYFIDGVFYLRALIKVDQEQHS